VDGAAVRSFGAEVALMAGLPKTIADSAVDIAHRTAVRFCCFCV
jgi:DNA mismatch repair ATPase MutS